MEDENQRLSEVPNTEGTKKLLDFHTKIFSLFEAKMNNDEFHQALLPLGLSQEKLIILKRQLLDAYKKRSLKYLKSLFDEVDLVDKLQKFSNLVEESGADVVTGIWEPSGNPEDHLRSYRMSVLQEQESHLNLLLQEQKQRLGVALQSVQSQSVNISNIFMLLDAVKEKLSELTREEYNLLSQAIDATAALATTNASALLELQ